MGVFVIAAPTRGTKGVGAIVADALVAAAAAADQPPLAALPLDVALGVEEAGLGIDGSVLAPTDPVLRRIADVAADSGAWGHTAAREECQQHLGSESEPVLSHPELHLTLPFWRQALRGEHRLVFVVRDPVVAASTLTDLGGFSSRYALVLWERWTRNALAAASGLRVAVIEYDQLLGPAPDVAGMITGVFGDELGSVAMDEACTAATDALLADLPPAAVSGIDRALLSPQQVALAAMLDGLGGVHDPFSVAPPATETDGAEFVFESTAAVLRNTGADATAQSAHTDALLADVRAENEKAQAAVADEFAAIEADLHDELDRLRDMVAAGEEAAGDLLDVTERAAELEAELADTIHTRNVAAEELKQLRDRPTVKWGLRVANQTNRAVRVARDRRSPEPSAPVAAASIEPRRPAEPDWDHLAKRVREGVFARPVTVIVPIYNAIDAVERCIEALDHHTPLGTNIVLIDDASTDDRLDVVLDQIRDRDGVTVLSNTENRGFTATVNRGLDHAPPGDVVLLNSDTQVTPRWLWRLRVAAHERPNIATVTPLSNHAGVFSFDSPDPVGLDDHRAIGAAVARGAEFLRPTSPTGNGFAMFISAEARAAVPLLDVAAFPRGYGEENDYCMKLGALGFEHVIADDTVVFHEESASFGDAQREMLIGEGLAVLAQRYPEYDALAQAFVASPAFVNSRAIAADSVAPHRARAAALADPVPDAALPVVPDARPRVLSILHAGGGGTEFHARDLADAVIDDYDTFLLRPFGDSIELWRHAGEQWAPVDSWQMSRIWDVRRFRDPEVAAVILEVLTRYDIELVHVQHLIGLTLDLPELAAGLGVPLVMSLHDYYMACPSVNLLDNNVEYCGGVCTPGEGSCQVPVWVPVSLPLKHRFVHLWRHETRGLFDVVPQFVTPSNDARNNLLSIFGDTVGDQIAVIEHGLDIDRGRSLARYPEAHEPVRILMVGGLNQAKGAGFAHEIAAYGAKHNVTVELLGKVEPGFERGLVCHGEYERDELPRRIAEIRPTFVGVFSVWPETHCYVVSEAWASGIPLLVGPLGAPVERVHEHGGGHVVEQLDAQAVVEAAIAIGRDRRRYNHIAAQARVENVRTLAEMGADWIELYDAQLAAARGRRRD